jgi:hypothetical protein
MKRYFDQNNRVLNIGDVVRFFYCGADQIGRITKLKKQSGQWSNYDIAYVTSLEGYRFGSWEATCILSKVPDEELMLIVLENS